eukprot:3894875-Pyramimonas_sp.AAC.1
MPHLFTLGTTGRGVPTWRLPATMPRAYARPCGLCGSEWAAASTSCSRCGSRSWGASANSGTRPCAHVSGRVFSLVSQCYRRFPRVESAAKGTG